jgi:hypothetical protein
VRWSGRGAGHGCPKSSKPARRPSARPWASWSANSSGCCWTLPGRGGGLAELEHRRQELDRRRATLAAQQRQLDAVAEQRLELRAVADGIEAFCQRVRSGLATATFAQRRLLVELLIDRLVVTDGEVEIRYVLPTSPDGPHPPFATCEKTISTRQRHPATWTKATSGRPVRPAHTS